MDVPPTALRHAPHRVRGLALATLTAVLWGVVPIAGKVALGGMSAPWVSVLRLAFSGIAITLFLAPGGRRALRAPPRLVGLAALGLGGNYVLYMGGLEHAGAGTSQVLIQTAPLFLVLLGILFLGERPTSRELVGAAAALGGVALVSGGELEVGPDGALGVALVLGAALAWSVYAVAHKRLGRDHAASGTMMWIFLLGAVVVLPTTFAADARSADAVQAIAIAFLCVNTLVAYWAFAEALRHIRATTAAVIATLGPAVTFGVLAVTNGMDQPYVPYEAITWAKILGSVLVLGGVGVAVTARR